MSGEDQPLPNGVKLSVEYENTLTNTPGLFAPSKNEIPKYPPDLTPEIVQDKFKSLTSAYPVVASALKTPEVLLFSVLSLHDEWGRPYNVYGKDYLRNLLSQVDPNKRKWTNLLSTTGTNLALSISRMNLEEIRVSANLSPLQTLVKTLLDLYPEYETSNQISYQLLDLDSSPRFCSNQSYYQNYFDKAFLKDRQKRLGIYLPPKDNGLWVDYVMESRDNRILDSLDATAFTLRELISIAEMLSETETEIRNSGFCLKTDFHKQIDPDLLWFVAYDPSLDFVDRYKFCLKLTKILSDKTPPSTLITSVRGIAELINSRQDRLEEFIDWVAAGGDEEIPEWLLKKKNGDGNGLSAKPAGERQPSDPKRLIEGVFIPQSQREIYYIGDVKNIPRSDALTPELLNELTQSGKITRLPLNEMGRLNTLLSEIFPDPKAMDNLGEHFANAVPLLACYSWHTITRRTKTTEKGRLPEGTRKLTGRRKKVGIYGVAQQVGDRQIIIMTPIQKKNLRD